MTGARTSAAAGATREDIERIELDCLLEAIYRRYGWDFREYSPASLRRRVWRRVRREGLESVSALQERILREPSVMDRPWHKGWPVVHPLLGERAGVHCH